MSKKNNVNPDHYKTAGRERPGENILRDVYKRRYTKSKSAGANARKSAGSKFANRRRGRAAIR